MRLVTPVEWLILPTALALGVTVLLAVPMTLFGFRLPEPVTPMVLAFAWPLVRPSMLAPVILAACGLFLDVLWGTPLGLWALALLVVYGTALALRPLLNGQTSVVRALFYAALCLLAFTVAWLAMAAIADNAPSLTATALQILPTLLLFPLANGMIERFDDGDVRFL